MITEADLYKIVVVHGDADAPDGTVGVLIEVHPDHVVVEELDEGPRPGTDVYFVGIDHATIIAEASAA